MLDISDFDVQMCSDPVLPGGAGPVLSSHPVTDGGFLCNEASLLSCHRSGIQFYNI